MKSWEEEQIRALAHDLWLRQGCPDGRSEEHWHEAEQLFLERWLADQRGDEHQVRDLRVQAAGFH